MDRFLLAENVNKGEARPLYVLQTIEPEMMIEIISYESLDEVNCSPNDFFDLFEHIDFFGTTEKYIFIIRKFYYLSDDDANEEVEKIRKHIKKAWKWYKSYLIKSDKEISREMNQNESNLN